MFTKRWMHGGSATTRKHALQQVAESWHWDYLDTEDYNNLNPATLHWEDFRQLQSGPMPTRLASALQRTTGHVHSLSCSLDCSPSHDLVFSLHGSIDGSDCRINEYRSAAGDVITALLLVMGPGVMLPPMRAVAVRKSANRWLIEPANSTVVAEVFLEDPMQGLLDDSPLLRSVEFDEQWLAVRAGRLEADDFAVLRSVGRSIRDAFPLSVLGHHTAPTPRFIDLRGRPASWLVRPMQRKY